MNSEAKSPGEQYANWKAPETSGQTYVGVQSNPDGSPDLSRTLIMERPDHEKIKNEVAAEKTIITEDLNRYMSEINIAPDEVDSLEGSSEYDHIKSLLNGVREIDKFSDSDLSGRTNPKEYLSALTLLSSQSGQANRRLREMAEETAITGQRDDQNMNNFRTRAEASSKLLTSMGEKLFPQANTELNGDNYSQILQEMQSDVFPFDINSQFFPDGIDAQTFNDIIESSSGQDTRDIESHLAELSQQVSSAIEGNTAIGPNGEVDNDDAVRIAKLAELQYRLESMRAVAQKAAYNNSELSQYDTQERQIRTSRNLRQNIDSRRQERMASQTTNESPSQIGEQPHLESPIKQQEAIKPNFTLKTLRTSVPLEQWSDRQIQEELIPHLQKQIDKLVADNQATGKYGVHEQIRVNDLTTDLKNIQSYLSLRKV